MKFARTYKRAPKGVRTPEEIEVDIQGPKDLGTFTVVGGDLVLKFADKTVVVMRLQKVTTYSEKKPTVDDFNRFVPPPADNEDDEPDPPKP